MTRKPNGFRGYMAKKNNKFGPAYRLDQEADRVILTSISLLLNRTHNMACIHLLGGVHPRQATAHTLVSPVTRRGRVASLALHPTMGIG